MLKTQVEYRAGRVLFNGIVLTSAHVLDFGACLAKARTPSYGLVFICSCGWVCAPDRLGRGRLLYIMTENSVEIWRK